MKWTIVSKHPQVEALEKIPRYAKFMKYLVNKEKSQNDWFSW